MPTTPTPATELATGAIVHLHAEGVSLVLDLSGGMLPAVVHWGAGLGPAPLEELVALTRAGVKPQVANVVDQPIRLAVLPEHRTGWTGKPGIAGHRDGADWSPAFVAVAARVGDVPLALDGPLALHAPGAALLEVDALDEAARLGLLLRVELLPSGLVRAQAELRNDGEGVYEVQDVQLALPLPPRASEVLDFAGRWGKERVPQRAPLRVGIHEREGRKGRTGADAATVLSVGEAGFGFRRGEVWGIHVAFSGNHRHYAERLFTGHQVLGGGELLLPGEMRLATGESYRSPWVYGAYGDGLDAQAARFHRYLRARPSHPARPRPVTLNVWEAVYFDHDLDRLLDLAERAAALGVERYVLDDGWFRHRRDDRAGLGDWFVDEGLWPGGLHPLVDRVRELGMEFGLWFEPEMVNEDSDLARAHPEWIMATGGRLPVRSRNQQVLNLGIPEAYAHVRDRMAAILSEYPIAYLKWDHNRDLIDAGAAPRGVAGVHEQTLACYRLMDELRQRFPGLEIESCSSGGGRVDLGVIERTDRVWVSDCIDPLERQQMMRWTMQLLPAELLGSHIASGVNHTTGRAHRLSFRAGTALFGHFGIEWDVAKATQAELAELAEWIRFYKQNRALLHHGALVRADEADPTLWVYGAVAPDAARALVFLAYLGRSEVSPRGRFTIPGLDPDRRYRVRPVVIGDPAASHADPDHTGFGAPLWAGRPRGEDGRIVYDGTVLSGRALGVAGLEAPAAFPDSVVLLEVDAVL